MEKNKKQKEKERTVVAIEIKNRFKNSATTGHLLFKIYQTLFKYTGKQKNDLTNFNANVLKVEIKQGGGDVSRQDQFGLEY